MSQCIIHDNRRGKEDVAQAEDDTETKGQEVIGSSNKDGRYYYPFINLCWLQI